MNATTIRYTMLAVRVSEGRWLARSGAYGVRVVQSYDSATHYNTAPECGTGLLSAELLRSQSGHTGAQIVAVDNDDQTSMRVVA